MKRFPKFLKSIADKIHQSEIERMRFKMSIEVNIKKILCKKWLCLLKFFEKGDQKPSPHTEFKIHASNLQTESGYISNQHKISELPS